MLHAAEMKEAAAAVEGAVKESHGLPTKAPQFRVGEHIVFTSSMVVTWIVALALILFAQIATRSAKLVPDRMQNFAHGHGARLRRGQKGGG